MYFLLISAVVFIILDTLFLWTRRGTFEKQIKDVQGEGLQMYTGAAVACYVLLILGLNYFILYPGRPWWDAFFLGVLVNGVFETTNYSIFKKWEFETVVVDTAWGGVLWGLTAFLTYQITDLIKV